MAEDGDPAVIEREVKCFNSGVPIPEAEQAADHAAAAGVSGVPGNDTISGFAWHPREESVLVSVMKSGRLSKCTGEPRRLVFLTGKSDTKRHTHCRLVFLTLLSADFHAIEISEKLSFCIFRTEFFKN